MRSENQRGKKIWFENQGNETALNLVALNFGALNLEGEREGGSSEHLIFSHTMEPFNKNEDFSFTISTFEIEIKKPCILFLVEKYLADKRLCKSGFIQTENMAAVSSPSMQTKQVIEIPTETENIFKLLLEIYGSLSDEDFWHAEKRFWSADKVTMSSCLLKSCKKKLIFQDTMYESEGTGIWLQYTQNATLDEGKTGILKENDDGTLLSTPTVLNRIAKDETIHYV